MAGYTEEGLVEKLTKLNVSQQSIQTLSRWIMYHRKRVQESVNIWEQELYKTTRDRKIIFLYLANDIMQNSRKKGGEFIKYFSRCIPSTALHVYQLSSQDDKRAIDRLLDIWDERRVFPKDYIDSIKNSLNGVPTSSHKNATFNAVNILDPSLTPPELHSSPSTPPHPTNFPPTDFPPSEFQSPNFLSTSVQDNLLSTSVVFKPLLNCLKEVESAEMSVGIVSEKATTIKQNITALLEGESLSGVTNQHSLTVIANDVEDAIQSLQQYMSSLQKEEQARLMLISELKQSISIQEEGILEAKRLISNCEKKLQLAEPVKKNMQELFSSLPSVSSPQKRPINNEKDEPQKRSKVVTSPNLTSNSNQANSPNLSLSNSNNKPPHNIIPQAQDPRISQTMALPLTSIPAPTSPQMATPSNQYSPKSTPQNYQNTQQNTQPPNKAEPWLDSRNVPQQTYVANNYQHQAQAYSNPSPQPQPTDYQNTPNTYSYQNTPQNYSNTQQTFQSVPNNNNYQPGTAYTFPPMWPQYPQTNQNNGKNYY